MSPLQAQTPDSVSLGRFHAHAQENGSTTLRSAGGYVLATVSFPTDPSALSTTLHKPDGTSIPLGKSGLRHVFDSSEYASEADLLREWPDGVYRVQISGPTPGEYRVRLSGVNVPPPPKVRNLPALARASTAAPVAVGWDPMQAPGPRDSVVVRLRNDSRTFNWMSPPAGRQGAIPATAASFTFPSLPDNADLIASLAFGRTADEFTANGGATVVSGGVAAVTQFPIRTGIGTAGSGAFDGETTLANSLWRSTSWFGTYFRDPQKWPWVFHAQHGWLYTHSDGKDGLFFWQPSAGWLWTKPSYYPYVYSYQRSTWLYYRQGSSNPRWFYDARPGQGWFRLD